MIGKFIKKLWKDWPEYEMTIKAEDLNKWEDALKEHDNRLEELKDIDTDLKAADKRIDSLKNAAQASEYANNLVDISREEKAVGRIQRGEGYATVYQIMGTYNLIKSTGYLAISDLVRTTDTTERVPISIELATYSNNYVSQYFGNYEGVVLEAYYERTTNTIKVHYENLPPGTAELIVTVKYTKGTR